MFINLQGTTGMDISLTVHQNARFSHNPKLSHESAVKRKGRYLLETIVEFYSIQILTKEKGIF